MAQPAGAYGAAYTQSAAGLEASGATAGPGQPGNAAAGMPQQNQQGQQPQQQIPQQQPQQFQQPQQMMGQQQPQQQLLQSPSPTGVPQATGVGPAAYNMPPPAAPPPRRGFFSIFRRRGEMPPPTGQPQMMQQSPQQAFPSTSRPQAPPRDPNEPPLPRDAQPMQKLFGGNWIFVIFIPYFAATAVQDTHLQYGLIASAGFAGAVIVIGLGLWFLNLRKVFPHILEIMMLVVLVIPLGVSYHSEAYKKEIIRTFPFILNSALAGTCLASMLVCYPVGYQTTQELVHRMYMGHTDVFRCGQYTTALLTASLISSDLLYLIPLCRDKDTRHWNALNLIFRIIYPCVATFLALLFVRFFPAVYLPFSMDVVHGLNKKPPARTPPYVANALAIPKPPTILDASMYQTSVDAATKVREASTMRPVPAAVTPRYSQGPGAGPRPKPSDVEFTPLPQGGPGGQFGAGEVPPGMLVAGGDPGEMFGGVVYPQNMQGHSVYTYFAAGPPNPPPLAVYAVYGDYDAPVPRQRPFALPGPGGMGAAPPPPMWDDPGPPPLGPMGNPLMAGPPRGGVQPLMYGGASRVVPGYGRNGGGPYGQAMYDDDYYYRPRQYGAGAYGAAAPFSGMMMQAPQRKYASAGGAGPYGVNMPLGELAGSDGRPIQGPLPPMRNPDAIVSHAPPPPYGNAGRYQPRQQYGLDYEQDPPFQPQPQAPAHKPPNGGKTYTYVGSLSVAPAGPPYKGQRHGAEDARLGHEQGYGMGGRENWQARRPVQLPPSRAYGLEAEQSGLGRPPPQRAGYGLDAEVGGPRYGMQYGGPPDVPTGGFRQQPQPPSASRFGLDAEADAAPGGVPGGYGSPARYGGVQEPGGGGGYGLDAEVGPTGGTASSTPPYTPGGLGGARGGAGGGYGLDAEVM